MSEGKIIFYGNSGNRYEDDLKIINKEKKFIIFQVEIDIKVIGKIIKKKEKEHGIWIMGIV